MIASYIGKLCPSVQYFVTIILHTINLHICAILSATALPDIPALFTSIHSNVSRDVGFNPTVDCK